MPALAAYADRLSARPGETIAIHVSSKSSLPVTARLVRVVCADPNPAGPGIKTEPAASDFEGRYEPRFHETVLGSYGHVPAALQPQLLASFTVAALIYKGAPARHAEVIVSAGGAELGLDQDGRLTARVGSDATALATPLTPGRWWRVWVTGDAAKGQLVVGAAPAAKSEAPAIRIERVAPLSPGAAIDAGAEVLIACRAAGDAHFNGKIEAPLIAGRVLTAAEIESAQSPRPTGGHAVDGLVARWDFSVGIDTQTISDAGPHARHGTVHNAPTRAVTGAAWSGREMCWRHAPDDYGAIHFHDDDLDDCRWPVTFRWTIAEGLRSGAYAVMLESGDLQENVPLFVLPPKAKRTADIAVLMSTFTYVVYANHARPDYTQSPGWADRWHARVKAWNAYRNNPADHPEYGLSTYNYHSDGSGIAISTWLRPILNLRVGYVTYPDEMHASGLRHYPADTHLLAWLEAKNLGYDVITDWELHHEGAALLSGYKVVLTGSHPEYHTGPMLDALTQFRDHGGRLCYLGGNGFYWKVALSKVKDGLIEIRRGEGGLRAWAAEPGEYYNQFDGEYGGLWRRNARPPQLLVGVGFTAQGQFVGSPYRLRPEAADPRVSWIFKGVSGDLIGQDGLSGHGAAGFELDRADARLGTPPNALVIARSEGHPREHWILTHEEQLTHITTIPGGPAERHIYADMVFFDLPGGGAVFSSGSITFCGALPWNGFDNDISSLMKNVCDRFLDPSPFEAG